MIFQIMVMIKEKKTRRRRGYEKNTGAGRDESLGDLFTG